MSTDPRLLAGIEAAVTADPANHPLRVHLAGLLCDAGRFADALQHATVVLADAPDDLGALTQAARAAEGCGDTERAARFRRLVVALGGQASPGPDTAAVGPQPGPAAEGAPAVPLSSTEDSLVGPGELDRFLEEVLADGIAGTERPSITLADVGGLDSVKRRLEVSFLGPLRNPELRAMYGTSLRGGLLLYGPPGCGKTHLARAVAGELRAAFIAVGLHDVLDMWLGRSEANLHAIFEAARRQAPCVVFFDEVDALGQKRTHLSHSAGRNVVVQFLSELDGMGADNEGIFVLGATNAPWDLDPALRRPGRFDRTVLVLPPDRPARVTILAYHLKGRPVGDVNLEKVAAATDGYSGADLRLVCETAAQRALEESLRHGRTRPISGRDLEQAAKEVKSTIGPWLELARNFALFANASGEYDDLMAYLRERRLV